LTNGYVCLFIHIHVPAFVLERRSIMTKQEINDWYDFIMWCLNTVLDMYRGSGRSDRVGAVVEQWKYEAARLYVQEMRKADR